MEGIKKSWQWLKENLVKNDWLAAGVICVVGAVIYSNSLQGEFHLDDFQNIAYNKEIRDVGKVIMGKSKLPKGRWVGYLSFELNLKLSISLS